MSKRRGFLIRLLLITVIICCSIHTSCGQENDTVNIPPPSSLPAKSEFSQEDILNHAQRSLDKSISILNTVASLMGVMVGLLALIFVILGAWGFTEIGQWKELRGKIEKDKNEAKKNAEEIEKDANEAKKSAEEAKKDADEAKKSAEEARPIIEGLKNAEEGLGHFREFAKDFPFPPEPFSEDQKRLLGEYGKIIELLEFFGVALKSEDHLHYGDYHYNRGEYELALKAYDKAIEFKPDFADAWSNRGVVLDELDRYHEALDAFDKAIEFKPDFANAWNNRGVVLDELERHNEALEAYDKAIEFKPDFADAWDNRGVDLGRLDHYAEALEAHNKAITFKPDFANAWYNKACTYSRRGDKENALKNLSKAIDLDAKFKETAKTDDDFKNLWDDDDFKRIVS